MLNHFRFHPGKVRKKYCCVPEIAGSTHMHVEYAKAKIDFTRILHSFLVLQISTECGSMSPPNLNLNFNLEPQNDVLLNIVSICYVENVPGNLAP
jgi:hypothetical protein